MQFGKATRQLVQDLKPILNRDVEFKALSEVIIETCLECMHVCKYACMHVCMHVSMYVCMYVCIYVCMYMHSCVCACMDGDTELHACMQKRIHTIYN